MVGYARVTGQPASKLAGASTLTPAPRFRPRQKVGVATTDFALFADVVEALKQAGIKFVDLEPGGRVPGNMGVVITTAREAAAALTGMKAGAGVVEALKQAGLTPVADPGPGPRWKGCRVLALQWERLSAAQRGREMDLLPFRVMWALAGYPLLWVGVDPGPRPGIAILASSFGASIGTDGSHLNLGHRSGSPLLLADYQAADEERAMAYLLGVLLAVGPGMMIVRVGHGAPLPRNRLANGVLQAASTLWGDDETEQGDGPVGGDDLALAPDPTGDPCSGSDPDQEPDPPPARVGTSSYSPAVAVEIVDETGSSSGSRKESNLAAAARIATIPGYRLRKPLRSHIKPTDIAKVQERSRRKTGGRRTLSADLAEAVAAGQMGLEEALEAEGFQG